MSQRRLVRMSQNDGAPPGSVYIGRGTILGNPFVMGRDGTRDEVVEKYAEYFQRKLREQGFVDRVLALVGDQNLACWCPPRRCHGDVVMAWLDSLSGPPMQA